LDELERCRYRLWNCIHKKINPSSFLNESFVEAILKPGLEFEAKILSQVQWRKTTESLREVMDRGVEAIKHPRLDAVWRYKGKKGNVPVKLVGIPDILIRNPFDRAYYCPVDIKHHREITSSDIKRILFYSFILRRQIYRNNKNFLRSEARRVHGYIWLSPRPTEEIDQENDRKLVPILSYEYGRKTWGTYQGADWDYRQYYYLPLFDGSMLNEIDQICWLHETLSYYPQGITEECSKCSLRKECIKLLTEHGDLSVLREIGSVRKSMLKACKIESIRQLYDMTEGQNEEPNVERLKNALDQRFKTIWKEKFNVAGLSLEKIAFLVKSLVEDKMMVKQAFEMPVAQTEFYIDLEYGSFPFCVGVKTVTGNVSQKFQKFVDDEKNAENVIRETQNLFRSDSHVAYVWRGKDSEILGLTGRSMDVFDVVNKYLFMPMKSYNIKDVAKYLGHVPPQLEIIDGLHCLVKFNHYLNEKEEPMKQHIREEILKYNWNDVESLYFIVKELKKLSGGVSQVRTVRTL
jgi:predicted RecB family nuclease